jgi:hypothetical protein
MWGEMSSEFLTLQTNERTSGITGKKQDPNSKNLKCQLIVADTPERIRAIWPLWNDLLQRRQSAAEQHPNTDMERFFSILGDADQPYVILLLRYGRPETMLLGRMQDIILDCKMGYLNLIKPRFKAFSAVYCGFLGKETYQVCRTLLKHLFKMLNHRICDVVEFEALPTDSLMFRLARKMPGLLTRGYFPKFLPRRYMSVPRRIDLFYKRLSKKHRYNLQRSIRMLEQHHSVRVVLYRTESELEEAIALASSVAQKTYQYDFGWGFADLTATKKRLVLMAKRDWLRFHILFIDDKPAAFQVGLQYQKTYYPELRGFDSDLKNLCIGTTLFLKVLDELCNDPHVDFLDFTPGDADYKTAFADNEESPSATIYFVAPRLYPICINILSSLTRGLTSVLESASRKIGLEHEIKNIMRTLLGVSK